jgi:hypothetical protein
VLAVAAPPPLPTKRGAQVSPVHPTEWGAELPGHVMVLQPSLFLPILDGFASYLYPLCNAK